jgi:hypothetical protein
VPLGLKVFKVFQATQAQLGQRGLQDQREPLVRLVLKGRKEFKVLQEILDRRAQLGRKGLKVFKA